MPVRAVPWPVDAIRPGTGTGPSVVPDAMEAHSDGPTRRSTWSWIVYDLANTLFSFVVLSFYFGPWVTEGLGARDSAVTVTESVSMLIVIVLAPVLGAVSDRTRRMPFLIGFTLLSVAGTLLLGTGRLFGLGVGPTVTIAIMAFAFANLGFQMGLVFYDALLPAVATPKTVGKVGAIGVGVGYLGSFVGLVLGGFILGYDDTWEPYLFIATGVAFLLFSLPCFLFVKERRPERTTAGPHASEALRSVFGTLKELPKDPRMSRFLVGRFLYADAVNTTILILGIYAVSEAGFETDSNAYTILLATGIVFAILAAPLWGMLVDRVGPKHTLDLVLLVWMLGLAVTVVHPLIDLPRAVFYMIGATIGIGLAGVWSADRPLLIGIAPRERVGEWFGLYALAGRFAAVTGPLLWSVVVDVMFRDQPVARPLGILSLLIMVAASFVVLRKLEDPMHPGANPLARAAPWSDGTGRRLARLIELPLRAPFTLLFVAASWLLFVPFARVEEGILQVSADAFDRWSYAIPDLTRDPTMAIRSLVTAPWLNHDAIQLVYVTVLLLGFALVFEIREGTRRTMLVFFATTFIGALFAGFLLHALRPWSDADLLETAWGRTWNGGSVGAFGIMGAIAARARIPWPLLAFFVFWEVNVGYWYLKSYTPAFHITALFVGFIGTRSILRPLRKSGARTAVAG